MALSRKTAISFNIILFLSSILFAILTFEIVLAPILLTILGMPNRELTLLQVAGRPNAQVDDVKINSQGFTGVVVTKPKPAGVLRILTLGGSAIFDRRMTQRLTTSLEGATSAHLEVVGGALRSHTTRHSVLKYKYFFHQLDFDYVLIYHGVNDLWMNHVPAQDFREDYSHMGPWFRRNTLLDNSLIARYIYNTMLWAPPSTLKGYGGDIADALLDGSTSVVKNGANFRSLETFEANLRTLIEMIRTDNKVPILMTFAWHIPAAYTKQKFQQNLIGYNNPNSYDKCPVELWGDVGYVREGLQRNNAIIRAIAKELNVLLIDQEENLAGDISNFGDVVHLSEVGTDRFGAAVTDFFLANQLLPRKVRLPPAQL